MQTFCEKSGGIGGGILVAVLGVIGESKRAKYLRIFLFPKAEKEIHNQAGNPH